MGTTQTPNRLPSSRPSSGSSFISLRTWRTPTAFRASASVFRRMAIFVAPPTTTVSPSTWISGAR